MFFQERALPKVLEIDLAKCVCNTYKVNMLSFFTKSVDFSFMVLFYSREHPHSGSLRKQLVLPTK